MRRNCQVSTFVLETELNEKDRDQDEKHEEDGRQRLTKASPNAQPPEGGFCQHSYSWIKRHRARASSVFVNKSHVIDVGWVKNNNQWE